MKLSPISRLSLVALAFLANACAVQKSKKDISGFGLFYHNLTAKYNGYFNARELVNLSQETLTNQYRDNFGKILELYEYNGVDNPSAATANLDIAIKKASTVINLHRPSHWVGDSYLLIGQAQYLKQDYETAEETFKYMVQNYNKLNEGIEKKKSGSRSAKTKEQIKAQEEVKKEREEQKKDLEKERKKKIKTREQENKEKAKARAQMIKDRKKGIKTAPPAKPSVNAPKPQSSADSTGTAGISASAVKKTSASKKAKAETEEKTDTPRPPKGKHRPVLQDGQLWLAKTYIMRKNGIAAGILLNQLKSDPGLFDEIKPEIPVLQGYNHIRQEEYREAIPYLREALASKDLPNKRKARIAFVLGQLYDLQHEEAMAYEAYDQVRHFSPSYELEFFARLRGAQSAIASGKRDKAQLLDELKKLSRDEKNADYLTSIYHTISLVNLSEGQRDLAKENLITGLGEGKDPIQKLESYYLLASMYNEEEDYLNAKKYYDSTLKVMSPKDLRHAEVIRYSESLTDIAKHLGIIQTQDSLLYISTLDEKDQKQWARRMLREREKTANVKVASTPGLTFDKNAFDRADLAATTAQGAGKSSFFAYDDKQLKKGIKDFERTWGNRKLQDNWRIGQKIAGNLLAADQQVPATETEEITAGEDLTSILKDIPNTPELKELAHEKIRSSTYALGVLYREKLENHAKAIAVLEGLLTRYPKCNLEQDALYQLYLACLQNGDEVKAGQYLDRLKLEYPGSKYTQSLADPNWMAGNQNKAAQLQKYYDETYKMFNEGQCNGAMDRIQQVDSLFKENPFRAKFALVQVLCTGRSQGRDAYINALKDFIARYPQSEERDRAKDMLRYILGDEKAFEVADLQKSAFNPNAFEFLEDELHYVIAVVYDKKESTLSNIKISISDFNQKYFQNDDLRISNIFLDQEATIPIIMIRKFDSATQALRYFNTVKSNANQFISDQIRHEVFPISQSNYRKLYATKDIESYKEFFNNNYKK